MKRLFKYTEIWGAGTAEWAMPDRDDYSPLTVGDRIKFEGRIWTVLSIDPSKNSIQLEN